MPVAEAHPSAEDLAAFTLGTLDDETQASIEAHVAACTSCQERAAVAPGDTLVELLRRVHARPSAPAETVTVAPQAHTPTPRLREAVAVAPPYALPADSEPADDRNAIPPELEGHERYRVVRLMAQGGMGSVYEAEQIAMRRRVALKVIHGAHTTNPAALDRFRREVLAAARLSHPNIVTAYDAETAGELHFLVMEYVPGITLGWLVKERGPLPIDEACAYVRQAALGLQHAHEKGLVHRDIKPDNLIRCSDGTVKVLDFGLAALTAEGGGGGLTEANVVMGTPDYMAPEQAEDSHGADIRADLYSLGCTLYYLLTGKPPYPAPTPLLKVLAHRDRPVPALRRARPDVPPELAAVVERLLAKKPEDRYQTPRELAAALRPFTRPPAKPRGKRGPLLVAAAVATLFAGIVLAGAAVYRIATDKGELVITTESDDVKVVITQGGKLVDVIDTKTDKQISLALRSGEYELELKGAPEGLKLNIDKADLKRGKTVLARITTVRPAQVALKYLALPIDRVASAVSTKSLWSGAAHERFIFPKWGRQEFLGIPFDVIDPKGESVKNVIVLEGCGNRERPLAVSLKCGSPAKAIHLLGGVSGAGWGVNAPCSKIKSVCVIVRLHYRDGEKEDHKLINGIHFCDIIHGNEVPGSQLAIVCETGQLRSQMRYLAIQPKNPTKVIDEIEFIKGKDDVTAPVIMAVTVERPVTENP